MLTIIIIMNCKWIYTGGNVLQWKKGKCSNTHHTK